MKKQFVIIAIMIVCICNRQVKAQSGWVPDAIGTTVNLNGLLAYDVYNAYPYWDMDYKSLVVGDSGIVLNADESTLPLNLFRLDSNITLNEVAQYRSNYFGVGEKGYILRFHPVNNGYAIDSVIIADSLNKTLNDITWFSRGIFFAVGDSGAIIRSGDNGATWNFYTLSRISENLHSVFMNDINKIYTVGDSGVFLTSFGSKLWSQRVSRETFSYQNLYDVTFIKDTGWVVGDNGSIYITRNGGYNWLKQTSGVSSALRSIYLGDGYDLRRGYGWAVGDSGVILKTTNSGTTWTRQESGTTKNLKKIYMMDSKKGIIIGDGGLILRTITGGESDPVFSSIPDGSLYFGNINPGVSKTGQIIVSNKGVQPLEISSVTSSNSQFTVTPASAAIAPGNYQIFQLVFNSSANGSWSGVISFNHNALGSPRTIYVDASIADTLVSDWHWQNPIPTGIQMRDADHALDRYFCVGDLGTLIKSSDGGLTWTSSILFEAARNNLNTVTFVTPFIGFVGGNSGTVLKTTDGGDTWNSKESNTVGSILDINMDDVSIGYMVSRTKYYYGPGYSSIYYTINGGNSWELKSVHPDISLERIASTSDSEAVVVGGNLNSNNGGIILRSTDHGKNWSLAIELTDSYFLDVKYFDNSTGIAVGRNGVIVRTTDGGKSWLQISTPTTENLLRISIIDAQQSIVAGTSGELLKTFDAGLNWTKIEHPFSLSWDALAFADAQTGIGLMHYPSNYNPYMKIVKTVDGGLTWTPLSLSATNRKLSSISSLKSGLGIAVGDSGLVLRTTDNGVTWSSLFHNNLFEQMGVEFHSVQMLDDNIGFIVGQSGTILHTTDGGISWDVQFSGTTNSLKSVRFINSTIGYVVGYGGVILKSTDLGKHWLNQSWATDTYLNSIYFIDEEKWIAVGDYGVMMKTTNGGEDWTKNQIGSTNLYSIHLHSDTGVVVGGGSIYNTTDAGVSWVKNECCGNKYAVSLCFTNSRRGYMVGLSGLIMVSADGGITWDEQNAGVSQSFYGISFNDENEGTIVGEGGVILHTTTGGVVDVSDQFDNSHSMPIKYSLMQNYPNPFNPTTNFQYSIAEFGFVSLKIYNLLGQEVATIVNGQMQPGSYKVTWEASQLSSGVYFYRLQSGKFTDVKKMVLMR